MNWKFWMPKISVEITTEQSDLLKKDAETAGVSIADYVRGKVFGSAAQESAPLVESPTVPAPVPKVVHRHSCKSWNPVPPPNYSSQSQNGTCMHPLQTGKPCFWAASTAKNCDKFSPLHQIRPPVRRNGI